MQVQWNAQNDGRCGACGDPFDQSPKPHEDIGGKYVTGVITGVYEAGSVMEAQVLLTAYHKGWFEFRCVSLNTLSKSKFILHVITYDRFAV